MIISIENGFEAVSLAGSACRIEDLLAPGLAALVGDPGHGTTLPRKKNEGSVSTAEAGSLA